MSRTKLSDFTGSAELNAMIERVAPDILALLADGVPRRKPAIVAALAGRHAADDVGLTLVRLAVTGQVGTALLLDHFGALNLPAHPASPMRVLGAALIVAGMTLVARF